MVTFQNGEKSVVGYSWTILLSIFISFSKTKMANEISNCANDKGLWGSHILHEWWWTPEVPQELELTKRWLMSCSVGKTKLLPVQFQFQNWIIKFRKDLRVVIDSSVESLEYEHHLPKKKKNNQKSTKVGHDQTDCWELNWGYNFLSWNADFLAVHSSSLKTDTEVYSKYRDNIQNDQQAQSKLAVTFHEEKLLCLGSLS